MNKINNHYDILIVGAGPAGLSAATYCIRGNIKVAMIDKGAPGGKMVKTAEIDNFIGFPRVGGPELSIKMYEHATNLGVELLFGEVIRVKKNSDGTFIVKTKIGQQERNYTANTVIIATGTIERLIGIPNEVEFYGRGVSYCAICDAALYKKRPVVVIGGGNAACEESVYLTKFASIVYLVHRRFEFRATKGAVSELYENKNIQLHLNHVATEILVNGSNVIGLNIMDKETKKITTLNVDCVFPFIGQDSVSTFVDQYDELFDLDKFIKVDEKMETKILGLFACGDILSKNLRQIANAVGEGAIAGQNAVYYNDAFLRKQKK